jgi:hypothetical protein
MKDEQLADAMAEQMIKDTFDVKLKGEVLTTNNYDLFGKLDSNRDISEKNYKKLIQSLSQKNVYGASTILVKKHNDGLYYIYEGQHRFEALKKLNQPIDFIVNQHLTTDDISLMNTASEVWILKDFLKKYLHDEHSENNPSYRRFKTLFNTYGTEEDDDSIRAITFTDILYITKGFGTQVTKQFKDGMLNISDEEYNKAVEVFDIIRKFLVKDKLPLNINCRQYIRGLFYMLEKVNDWETKDVEILLDHTERHRSDIDYKNFGSTLMYVNLLVGVYNKGQKKRFIESKTIKGGKENIYYISEY